MADFIAENMNLNQVLRRIKDNKKAISSETERAKSAENSLSTRISSETERAKSAENSLSTRISSETERAKSAEEANASAIARLTTTTNTKTENNIYNSQGATAEETEWYDGSMLFLATTDTITEDNFENFSILVKYFQEGTLLEEVTYKLSELTPSFLKDDTYLYAAELTVPAPNENYASSVVFIVYDKGAMIQFQGMAFSSEGIYLGRRTSDSGIYTNVYSLTEWGYESTVVINNEVLDLPNNTDFKNVKTEATSANTLALKANSELNNKADKLENTSSTNWCVPMYAPSHDTPQLIVASNEALGGTVVMSDNDGNISLPSVDKIKGSDEGGNDNRAASIAKVNKIIESFPTSRAVIVHPYETLYMIYTTDYDRFRGKYTIMGQDENIHVKYTKNDGTEVDISSSWHQIILTRANRPVSDVNIYTDTIIHSYLSNGAVVNDIMFGTRVVEVVSFSDQEAFVIWEKSHDEQWVYA